MNANTFSKSSALVAIGMICASVAMLTQNSIASAHHAAVPAQHVNAPVVTELPPVVVTGKRMSAAEKSKYLQLISAGSATLI